MWTAIAQHISAKTGTAFTIQNRLSVGGGCINQTYQIADDRQRFFLKLNAAAQVAMFEAEALGLKDMYDSQTIRVPKPICWGTADSNAYLVMEWLDLGHNSEGAWRRMGEQLAAMHRVSSDRGFGWHQSNTIGATPSPTPE